jgi:transcriptional regulator with AAA-type ATPase domain
MVSRQDQQVAAFKLLILSDGSARSIRLTGNRWTIGRSLDCDITLRDPTVSRRQLILERKDDEFHFEDLGSPNPPHINGKAVRQGQLKLNQEVAIGLSKISLRARDRLTEVTTSPVATTVLSREVIDEEIQSDTANNAATVADVLHRIEWSFAALGDLADAAAPLLELSLNLTQRQSGWIARFPDDGTIETLASVSIGGSNPAPALSDMTISNARSTAQVHILKTDEAGEERERLIIPLGNQSEGLMVLESPMEDAARGQDLLRLAHSLGKVAWHRLKEAIDRIRIEKELQRLSFHGTESHSGLLASLRLTSARESGRRHAVSDNAIVIVGEPGCEHEELSRYIHAEGPRCPLPFACWDASKIAPSSTNNIAKDQTSLQRLFDKAGEGTLMLQHPESLAQDLQRELAAAIGRSTARTILCSSNPPTSNSTWEDSLRILICDQQIIIPPLRSDARDILALAELFLTGIGSCPDGSPRLLSESCKRSLSLYNWPGNVRELRSTLETAAAIAGNRPISPRHLPNSITSGDQTKTPVMPTLASIERAHIQEVMIQTSGVRAQAARILGIANSTLYHKLRKYNLDT